MASHAIPKLLSEAKRNNTWPLPMDCSIWSLPAARIHLKKTGILKTGGDEESRIYIPLAPLENWTAVRPSLWKFQFPDLAVR